MELKSLTQGFYIWVVDSGLKYDFIKFVSIFMLLVEGDSVQNVLRNCSLVMLLVT